MAEMNVLIVGSLPKGLTPAKAETYRTACRQLGAAIAERGWSVNVGTDKADTADALVVEGVRKAGREARVRVFYHDYDKPEVPFEAEAGAGEKVHFQHVHGPGTWADGREDELRASDVMILLGGSDKSAAAGLQARLIGLAYLPIPTFGGAGGAKWDGFADDALRLSLRPVEGLRANVEPWKGPESAAAVLDFARQYLVRRRLSLMRRHSRVLLRIVPAAAVATWAALLFMPPVSGAAALFGVLVASAVMGTTLERLIRVLRSREPSDGAELFWVRAGAAIIEAIALLLLFALSAFSMSGSLEFLEGLSDRTAYLRAAMTGSVLGLACGFVTESIGKSLAARLGQFAERGASSEPRG